MPQPADIVLDFVVREWRGRVAAADADAYVALMHQRAIPDYRRLPGNLGAFCHTRTEGDVVHVAMVSWWRDHEAIAAFAGDDIALARYYDFDPDFLLELPLHVEHRRCHGAVAPALAKGSQAAFAGLAR